MPSIPPRPLENSSDAVFSKNTKNSELATHSTSAAINRVKHYHQCAVAYGAAAMHSPPAVSFALGLCHSEI